MSARNLLIAAGVIASGFAGGIALAQPASQPQPGAPAAAHVQRADRAAPGQFIEGRIAFLKTELKPTAQQTPLFDKLADEMRTGAKAMQERHAQRQQASAQATSPEPRSALEKLERRSTAMKEMAAVQDRYLAAFRPLYQSLSDDQKKTADLLFARGHGGPGSHTGGKHRMHKHH